MIAPKLAWRNLVGAGLRTWLSVIVLSMSYVIIIMNQGVLDGWNDQARRDMTQMEIGAGQYWHKAYDAFTLDDSHGTIPSQISEASVGEVAPILICRATIYPQGRMLSVLLKGISPNQKVLGLPTSELLTDIPEIPVLIGTRMAKSAKIKKGDLVTIRWRDSNGTFDAAEAKVVTIMKTSVPAVDQGQIWLPLDRLQKMMQLPGKATIMVVSDEKKGSGQYSDWVFKDRNFLTMELTNLIKSKKAGGAIMYFVLLSLALLAIFDTQVLSVFRRRKEIGTLIALGMTRSGVIRLFTVEGAMHGVLAAILASLYGVPILGALAIYGIGMPKMSDNFGLPIGARLFPVYGVGLVIGTTAFIMIAVTIVSFLPARRIASMKPTDALRGKMS